jgi:hypothetical protein
MDSMTWLVFWIAVLLVAALATLVNLNGVRFQDRVRKDGRRRLRAASAARDVSPMDVGGLPGPVQRYLVQGIRDRTRSVRTVRLRHGGRFRTRPGGSWLAIRGEQYFAASPPSFLWWGRVHPAPGLWIDARDQIIDGHGSILAQLGSTLTVSRASGPAMDQGALLRLLVEMVWFPTAFLDDRFVSWEEIDDRSARATLHHPGREASATFHFRRDGLPRLVTGQRYRDARGGAVLTPWSGRFEDYRLIDGMMVPLDLEARWHLDSGEWPYAHFKVERIEYDRDDTF